MAVAGITVIAGGADADYSSSRFICAAGSSSNRLGGVSFSQLLHSRASANRFCLDADDQSNAPVVLTRPEPIVSSYVHDCQTIVGVEDNEAIHWRDRHFICCCRVSHFRSRRGWPVSATRSAACSICRGDIDARTTDHEAANDGVVSRSLRLPSCRARRLNRLWPRVAFAHWPK